FRDTPQAEGTEAVVLHAIRLAHGPVPVAQERVVDPVLLLEDPMAVVAVRADAEHLRPDRLQVAEGVPQRAQLSLARGCKVEHVEGKNPGTWPKFLRKVTGLRPGPNTLKSGPLWSKSA